MKIGYSTWTGRNYVKSHSLIELVNKIANEFKIECWEGCMGHFGVSEHPEIYSAKGMVNLVGHTILDSATPANYATTDEELRRESVEASKKWIDFVADIGAVKGVKLNPGNGDNFGQAVKSYLELNEYAKSKKLLMMIENASHKGPMATPEHILNLVSEVNDKNFGINLDLGNFDETGKKRLELIEAYFPYTKFVEMKTKDLGGDYWTSVEELQLVAEMGYDSYIFVDYSGENDWKKALGYTIQQIQTIYA